MTKSDRMESHTIEAEGEVAGPASGESRSVGAGSRLLEQQARRAANARKSSGRRRLVDPATTEKTYSKAEIEFMNAMQEYKKRSGRMFPTWSEVLEVLRDLGYQKTPADYLAREANAIVRTV